MSSCFTWHHKEANQRPKQELNENGFSTCLAEHCHKDFNLIKKGKKRRTVVVVLVQRSLDKNSLLSLDLTCRYIYQLASCTLTARDVITSHFGFSCRLQWKHRLFIPLHSMFNLLSQWSCCSQFTPISLCRVCFSIQSKALTPTRLWCLCDSSTIMLTLSPS